MSTTSPTSWSSTSTYTAGMTVVVNGVTYVANWWTQGTDPTQNNGAAGTGEPWTIVATSGSGTSAGSGSSGSTTVAAWNAASAYTAGSTVSENGVTYVANWWSQGTDPAKNNGATGTGEPWTIVTTGSGSSTGTTSSVPTVPTGLTATSTASDSTVLTWAASTVPGGGTVTGYAVFQNGNKIGTTAAGVTSYTATGLSAATAYQFTVEALDSAGASAQSATLSVTTAAAASAPSGNSAIPVWSATAVYTAGQTVQENGEIYKANWWTEGNDPATNSANYETWTLIGKVDTTPTAPDAPTGLTATAVSSSEIDLYWTAANVKGSGTVSEYEIFQNGKEIATTTHTYYDVGSLTASTAYTFTVEAVDATGASPSSAAAAATTLAPGAQTSTAIFSPYVDLSLYGTPSLVDIAKQSGVMNLTLAFIQSSGTGTIGWAGTGTIQNDTLPDGSTVQSEIQAFQAIGGKVTISFGGSAGTDPAVAAAAAGMTAAQLQAEYQSVIDRYGVTSLDFDIEGSAEANQASLTLRDQAIKGLEAANPGLQISYTVPVLPTGLDYNGLNIIETAVKDGVRIDVVNIMTMDYGSSVDNGGAMGTDAIDAIKATEAQVAAAGLGAKIGVSPMIGVNDVSSEVFTLADAQQLAAYVATDSNVASVGMWSIGRDNGSAAGDAYATATGSGLSQANYAFSSILQHA